MATVGAPVSLTFTWQPGQSAASAAAASAAAASAAAASATASVPGQQAVVSHTADTDALTVGGRQLALADSAEVKANLVAQFQVLSSNIQAAAAAIQAGRFADVEGALVPSKAAGSADAPVKTDAEHAAAKDAALKAFDVAVKASALLAAVDAQIASPLPTDASAAHALKSVGANTELAAVLA
ncbi:MAG: hypothetical protein AB7F28_08170 [Candidatus Margulisiibacteriota bacterium]